MTTTLASDTDSTTASYTTTYAYQGTTDLVSSVTQSDGTTVSYSYTQDTQGVYQVTGITTGSGSAAQTLTLSYGTNDTTVTDGLGNTTHYHYNAQGQLTQVIAPAVNGASPTTSYTYDANGNLLTRTDPNGAVTSYAYDANGNLVSVEDGDGNTVSYTYNTNDQVTSKTTYTVAAQGQAGQSGYVAPSGAETTYYVYNATNQLAYTIDALGAVTEHDYTIVNGLSERTTTRQYLGATYSTSSNSNSPSSPPTLAQLQAWVQSSAVQSTLSQSTRTDYSYDVRGQLATQTHYDTVDSSGNGVLTNGTVITTTTYDAQGRLLQTSAKTGTSRSTLQTTTYAYDGLGRVISKTDPLGHVTSYVYTDSANTLAITQANGLTTTQVRNSAGQLLSSTASASGQTSRVTNYLYNADGQAIAAIDPAGNVTYTFYNADGEVAGTVDGDGNVTAYTYDADGHVIQTTQYATPISISAWISGGALTSSYPTSLPVPASTASDRTSTSIYNAAGQIVATIDPVGNVTTIIYDGAGHALATTQYATPLTPTQRNSLGNPPTLANLTPTLAANASNRTTLSIVDADGRAVASIDAQGYVIVTTYNDAGEAVLRTAYATALTPGQLGSLGDMPTLAALQADITTSAQDQTTRSYYDGEGRVVATIDAGGYLTTTAYDETTDITTTTRYATALTSSQLSALTGSESVATLVGLLGSNPASETSSVSTDADGQVVTRVTVEGVSTTYTYYAYNKVGQVTGTATMPAGEQGAIHTTATTYDAFGDTLTRTDAAGATTTYVYNALGQQVEATDALGNSTWSYYDADGKLLYTIQGQPSGSTRNALGNVTAYQYNAFGEVISTTTYAAPLTLITTGTSSGTTLNITTATTSQVTAAVQTPLAAPSGDANATITTTYTLDGQVATVTDGNGYQTASTYDAFGDVIQTQQQLSQPGSALSASNSTLTATTYDHRGEAISTAIGVDTSVAQAISQTYDAFGRVTSRTDGNGNSITYHYDALGRQVSSSQTVQGSARTTQTTYDAFGHVLSETDALGNVTTFSYNLATHTTTTTTPLGVTMATVKDAFGDTVSVTDGAGHTTTYTYDADGRLLTTTDALGHVSSNQYNADGDLIQATDATGHVVTTTYNASGKVLTQTVDPSGLNLTTTYAYDAQGRQLSVTDPTGSVTTYRYDADGNVLTKVVDTTGLALATTYTYDGAGKALTVTTGYGTSAATTTQYVYDNLERLYQTIVAPGQLGLTTTYSYDANNNLVSKTDANGNVTRYIYDEANEKIFTIDPTGAVTQNWYDADGRATATRTYATVLSASQLSALGSTPTVAAVSADLTASSADRSTQSAYNADGQVIYQLNGSSVTQLTYNAAGQVTQTRQYATALSTSSLSPTATTVAVAADVTASSNDLITTTAYDADGRAVYGIDGAGDVTQTVYDAAGRVTQTIAYATPLTSAQLTSLGSTPTTAQVAALITTGANDRTTTTSYDTAGRVVVGINAAGAVTQTTYDADGRVTSTHAYATALTPAQLSTLGSAPTPAQTAALLTTTASDAITFKVYDGAGNLRDSIDPLGYVTEMRYDATGRVIETLAYANAVSTGGETSALQAGTALSWISTQVGGTSGSNPDSSAEATLFLYDTAGRRAFAVQQNGTMGQVTAYAYDANGGVIGQTVYGNTLTLSSSQSLSAQLTTASVASAVASFTHQETTHTVYDGDHRALYTIDALGDVTQMSYDGVGRLIETQQYANPITLPSTISASTIAAAITAAGGATGERLSSTSYNSQGQVLSTTDALGTNATYTYNALGQKTSYTNRDGATWNYVYDSAGRLIQTQSPQVTVGSYSTTNGQFQTAASQYLYTSNTYDAFGNVTSTSQGYGASASAITTVSTTSYAYDALNRRIQTTDALGHTTTTTYNALGQAVVAKDANGNLTYKVYGADGHLLDSIDGNGYVTAHTYDAYGNVLTTTQYATALNTSAITGWSAGQPLTAAQVQQGLVTSSNDRTVATTYNQLNQKIEVVKPSITWQVGMGPLVGNTGTDSPTTLYSYDAYGNQISRSTLIQAALTSGSVTSPAIWATTYTYYDALNRAVMTVTPAGSYTSPQGYVTTTAYNAFGQVSSSTQYAQAISTSGITTSAMPSLPAAATRISGADRVTSYTYDALGRVSTELDIGGYNQNTGYGSANVSTVYTYNGENQILSKTHNGAVTSYTYDALGRVLTVNAPARGALVSNWQSILESTPADNLTTASLYANVSPVTTYVYDAQGNALCTNVSAGGLSQQTYTVYNALGQQTEIVDADGNAHTTTYDANGNVHTQSYTLTTGVTVTTTHTYDADNQLLSTAVQRSNASTDDSYTQQKYSAFGEVIAKGDNNGYEANYDYDNDGNPLDASDSKTDAKHHYGYDLVGTLVSDNSWISGGSGGLTWTLNQLDLSGNIVAQQTPATNAAGGAISTPILHAYDRWGNLTSTTDANGNVTTYQYDSQNHLIQQTDPNVLVVSASGVYTWTTPTETWAYNVNGELQQHTDANGNLSVYVYDAAGNQTQAEDGAGAYTFTGYDALGRAVAVQAPPVQSASGALANITFTAYDNLNQVTGQGYFQLNTAGTARTPVTQSSYILNANGDRIQTTDALGNRITYTYDSQHRVLTSTTPLNETTTYVYDVNGNLVHQTDADGYTQSWTYNYFKQVQTHTDESGATYTYTYDANSGLMTKETSNWTATGPSGAITSTLTYSYDADGALAGLTDAMTSGSSTVTSTYGYGYDANGNETLETINTQDGGGNAVSTQIVIGYDSHNRLQEVTDENGAGTVATMRSVYVYDADGNRRAVFTRSAYSSSGAAAAVPLTTGVPALGTALANQTASLSGSSFAAMSYNVSGNFTDPLGMGLTYTATGLPSWLSLNGTTGVISGTPPVPTAPTSYTVSVTAMDALGRSVSGSFTVTVPKVNPVFGSAPSAQTAQPGAAWSYQAPAATDANGYGITYSASGMPPGISFNASTRTFSGTPSTGGGYTVTYTATSSAGTTASTSFTITVPYVAPVFSGGVSNQTVQPGTSLNYQAPAATDANGYGINYSATNLPPGISFNAATRTFSGSLTTAGNWVVTYTAAPSAGSGGSVSQQFSITVPAATPVFAGNPPNQTAQQGQGWSYQAPTASDANGAGISYSASGMPPGIGFDASSRTFSGTPTASGSYTVTYTAAASDGPAASTTFVITVNAASPPQYVGTINGQTYTYLSGPSANFNINASGQFRDPQGEALSYTAKMASGSALLSWINFNASTQTFTGGLPANTGTNDRLYTIQLTATDTSGLSSSLTFTIDDEGSSKQVVVRPSAQTAQVQAAQVQTTQVQTTQVQTTQSAPATPNIQADWFTYDADGRVLVADGALQNGQVVITSASNSSENSYDAAGDVIQNLTASGTNQKNYYNALGQLTMVQATAPGGSAYGEYESRSYDADGRLVQDVIFNTPNSTETTTSGSFSDAGWVRTDTLYTYNADGELTDESEYAEESAQSLINQYGAGNVASSAYATEDKTAPSSLPTVGATTDGALYLYTENSYTASTGYGYDADGNALGYHTVTGGSSTVLNASPTASTVGYQNAYVKQNGLLLSTTTEIPSSGSNTVTTSNTYNDLGELASSTGTVNGAAQTQVMAYTAGGQLLQKSATSNGSATTTIYASVNENQLGSVDTAGSINVLSTTGGFANGSTGTQSYTVQAGDTLQSLAQAIYGDSNYYYILAQANGLSPTATLSAGMMLKIPQVTTSANAYNTYQPYSAGADISGSASSMYTVAQIVARSIEAIFNQQSAIAQTVAQIEAQQQQIEEEQAQAEQAKALVEQQAQRAAEAQQAAIAAKEEVEQAQQQAEQAQREAAQAQAAATAELQAKQQAQAALEELLQTGLKQMRQNQRDLQWEAYRERGIESHGGGSEESFDIAGGGSESSSSSNSSSSSSGSADYLNGWGNLGVSSSWWTGGGSDSSGVNAVTGSDGSVDYLGGWGSSSVSSSWWGGGADTSSASNGGNADYLNGWGNLGLSSSWWSGGSDSSNADYLNGWGNLGVSSSWWSGSSSDLSNYSLATAGPGVGDTSGDTSGDNATYGWTGVLYNSGLFSDGIGSAFDQLATQYDSDQGQFAQYSTLASQDQSLYGQDSTALQLAQGDYQTATDQVQAADNLVLADSAAAQAADTQVQQAQAQVTTLDTQLGQESNTGSGLSPDSGSGSGSTTTADTGTAISFNDVKGGVETNALDAGSSSTTYSALGSVVNESSQTYATSSGQPGAYNSQTGQIISVSQAVEGVVNAGDGMTMSGVSQTGTPSTDVFVLPTITVDASNTPSQTVTPATDDTSLAALLHFNLGITPENPYVVGGALNPLPSLAPKGPVMSDSTPSLLAQQAFRQQLGGVLVAGASPMMFVGGVDSPEATAPSGSNLEPVSLSVGESSGGVNVPNTAPPGTWTPVNESMSDAARAYQTQITGQTGQAYVVGGVKFDGVTDTSYLDAKGPNYSNFVNSDGEFSSWWKGSDSFLSQAQRQLNAANGYPIEWHFAEGNAANATRSLFNQNGINGIQVIHTPFLPN